MEEDELIISSSVHVEQLRMEAQIVKLFSIRRSLSISYSPLVKGRSGALHIIKFLRIEAFKADLYAILTFTLIPAIKLVLIVYKNFFFAKK